MQHDFAPNENLKIDVTTCPFDKNHKIFRQNMYTAHLRTCGMKSLPHVAKHVRRCPFVDNDTHVVLGDKELNYHIPRCPEHPQRQKYVDVKTAFGITNKPVEYVECPNNPFHLIRKDYIPAALEVHLQECPNASKLHIKTPFVSEIRVVAIASEAQKFSHSYDI